MQASMHGPWRVRRGTSKTANELNQCNSLSRFFPGFIPDSIFRSVFFFFQKPGFFLQKNNGFGVMKMKNRLLLCTETLFFFLGGAKKIGI